MRKKMLGNGYEPVGGTPEEFARHIRAERDKWIPLFRKIGIQPQ